MTRTQTSNRAERRAERARATKRARERAQFRARHADLIVAGLLKPPMTFIRAAGDHVSRVEVTDPRALRLIRDGIRQALLDDFAFISRVDEEVAQTFPHLRSGGTEPAWLAVRFDTERRAVVILERFEGSEADVRAYLVLTLVVKCCQPALSLATMRGAAAGHA